MGDGISGIPLDGTAYRGECSGSGSERDVILKSSKACSAEHRTRARGTDGLECTTVEWVPDGRSCIWVRKKGLNNRVSIEEGRFSILRNVIHIRSQCKPDSEVLEVLYPYALLTLVAWLFALLNCIHTFTTLSHLELDTTAMIITPRHLNTSLLVKG